MTEVQGLSQIINGKDVMSRITIVPEPREYREGSKLAGQSYHIGRFQGKGFTCTLEFYEAWKAGKVQELTLTENEYERPNPEDASKTILTKAWTLDGYMTSVQYNGFLKNQVETRELEVQLNVIEKKAIKQLNLTEADVALLETA